MTKWEIDHDEQWFFSPFVTMFSNFGCSRRIKTRLFEEKGLNYITVNNTCVPESTPMPSTFNNNGCDYSVTNQPKHITRVHKIITPIPILAFKILNRKLNPYLAKYNFNRLFLSQTDEVWTHCALWAVSHFVTIFFTLLQTPVASTTHKRMSWSI